MIICSYDKIKKEAVMEYRIIGIVIMITFYLFYIAKLIVQGKQNIKTNQMGKGNKKKQVLVIERFVFVSAILAIIVTVYSILFIENKYADWVKIMGIMIGILAVIIFALATITMKNSWRVGIPEERTALITGGIYKLSRNPAFVGFDLLYLSMCLMYFNIPLLMVSGFATVMLHLQILQEEEHMQNMFGMAYEEYRKRTMRYFGRK